MPRTAGSKNKPKNKDGSKISDSTTNVGNTESPVESTTPPQHNNEATSSGNVQFDLPKNDTKPEVNMFDETIPVVENPLERPVVEKGYTAINDKTQTSSSSTPTSSDNKEFKESTSPSEPEKQKLTPEEIKSQAEQTAAMFWKFYEKIHGLLRWWGKVDENELVQEHLAGDIDLDLELPLGKTPIKLRTFIEQINNTIGSQIVISDELKEALTPAIVRICMKRGWLIGDETYVAWTLLEDMATKIGILMGLKKSQSLILDSCRQIQIDQKKILKNQEDAKKKSEQSGISNSSQQNGQEHKAPEQGNKVGDNVSEWAATETRKDGSTSEVQVEVVGGN